MVTGNERSGKYVRGDYRAGVSENYKIKNGTRAKNISRVIRRMSTSKGNIPAKTLQKNKEQKKPDQVGEG